MTDITIDGKVYDLEALPEKARAQITSLRFVDAELQRLAALTATLQTARNAYAQVLSTELANQPPVAN
ncbi:MAG: DUF6447 family protein [Gammaproteobacteria bacterium]|nr:DUF6447 family protein [Gammaproteobacteria bacterium]